MLEYVPSSYELESWKDGSSPIVSLRSTESDNPFHFSFESVRPNLFRTTFFSNKHPLPPHPSAPMPCTDADGLHSTKESAGIRSKTITAGDICAEVDWTDSCPVVTLGFAGDEKPLYQDLPYRAYAVDGAGVAHYSKYLKDTLYVGLGEKAAPLNLSNRRFEISATDCFGYDTYRTDPMYKHIPLLINATANGCVGIFSTSHARGTYSVGAEMDGLWGHYKVYRQDHGGLEEYLLVGRTIKEVVRIYADLVGYPLLVPRWAFGYLAGGMKYSMLDEPRASEALMDFADKVRKHDIPCSGFQLSSGYTVAESVPKTRNVFTWNKHRFPDPQAFVDAYHARGIRLIANVKPYVLASHPEYSRLAAAGAFFRDPRNSNQTAVARLWSAGGGESGVGGHIDFTSAAGFKWWFEGVKSLKDLGIDCIWNDNNEYTIPDDRWQCALDGDAWDLRGTVRPRQDIGLWGRSLQTELMARSSYEAAKASEPGSRPFVLTRSASAGTMRYAASSWSGDNVTSWEGMKGANSLSLNAGICLLQCYGHDIGGFEGPQPSPELLLRWVQLGIHSPRFAINCYKTSPADNSIGDVIEPWMYPEITPLIRKAIKRRYELIPYLYSLALESHMTASPPQRWVGWNYESDPEVWTPLLMNGEEQYWLGDSLLVGGVYESGTTVAKLYLPTSSRDDLGFLNLNAPHQYLPVGQWVEIESEWKMSIPILAKVGSAIPVGKDVQTLCGGDKANPARLPIDDYRGIEIFPPQDSSNGRSFATTWYEDDGISAVAKIAKYDIRYRTTDKEVYVSLSRDESAGYVSAWEELEVILPVADERAVISEGGGKCTYVGQDKQGRRRFRMAEYKERSKSHL